MNLLYQHFNLNLEDHHNHFLKLMKNQIHRLCVPNKHYHRLLTSGNRVSCFNQALTRAGGSLSISFLANLLRITKTIWSFPILTFEDNKAIIHSPTPFRSFKISTYCYGYNPMFSVYRRLVCYPYSSTLFFNKLNP